MIFFRSVQLALQMSLQDPTPLSRSRFLAGSWSPPEGSLAFSLRDFSSENLLVAVLRLALFAKFLLVVREARSSVGQAWLGTPCSGSRGVRCAFFTELPMTETARREVPDRLDVAALPRVASPDEMFSYEAVPSGFLLLERSAALLN